MNKGTIVNVASISGLRASTLRVAYGTSKAAVIHLTQQQAAELGEFGIRVNCVSPGSIATEGLNVYPPEAAESFGNANPLREYGDAFDIAQAVIHVGSPVTGKFITEILTLTIIFSFIIFSPLACFLADRYSKRSVIKASLVAQVGIFVVIAAGIYFQNLGVALAGFALIAIQSVFFSSGKFGIPKELVGSKGVGLAASLLQMFTMLAILGGMWVSGPWFDYLAARPGAGLRLAGVLCRGPTLHRGWRGAGRGRASHRHQGLRGL